MSRLAHKSVPVSADYWQRSRQPLQALFFLLPFLAIYELGLLKLYEAKSRPIIAEVLLQEFFQIFGVHDPRLSYHLPAFVIVGVLLCWHVARRDRWAVNVRTYILMALEAMLLAVPLFVFMMVLFRSPQAATAAMEEHAVWQWAQIRILESIGAGLYEEFVFRLLGLALVHTILVNILALPEKWGAIGSIVLTSLLFSMAHFYAYDWQWDRFFFYAVAGVFFAMIYLLRGFGIAAAAHAAYNIYVVALQWMFYQQ